MMEQPPIYFIVMVYIMESVTVLMAAAMLAGLVLVFWDLWKKHKRGGQDGEGEGGDGGGGGWTDRPSGTPPGGGGPDRDLDRQLDRQFHAVADAIGKSIKIDENRKEKVLT